MISGVMSDNHREKGLQYVSWPDHHPGCDHPSHHITGENMLISQIYADTSDWPGPPCCKSYERGDRQRDWERSILTKGGGMVSRMKVVMVVMFSRPLSLPLLSSAHALIHCPYISTCQEQKEERGENIPITPEIMSGDLITPPTTTTHRPAGDLGCLVSLLVSGSDQLESIPLRLLR